MIKIPKVAYPKIISSYLKGKTTPDLARRYKVSPNAIRKLLRRSRIELRSRREAYYLRLSKAKPTIKIPEEEWKLAYLAGLIDGEGTIYLRRQKTGLRTGVRVCNCDSKITSWIAENFGGEVYYSQTPTGNPFYIWSIGSIPDCCSLLEAVDPFLVAKRDKAIKATKFCRRRMEIWKENAN